MITRGAQRRSVSWGKMFCRATPWALVALSLMGEPLDASAQSHAKLQGVFNAVTRMPTQSAPGARSRGEAPQAPILNGGQANPSSRQEGGSPTAATSLADVALSAPQGTSSKGPGALPGQHNKIEPFISDPVYPSGGELDPQEVLPFDEGVPLGEADAPVLQPSEK